MPVILKPVGGSPYAMFGSLAASTNFQRDFAAVREETRRKLGLPSAIPRQQGVLDVLPRPLNGQPDLNHICLIATLPEEFVIRTTLYRWSAALLLSLCSLLLSAASQSLRAQSASAIFTGTITDAKGGVLQNATIMVKTDSAGNGCSVKVDTQGHFSLGGFTSGRYTIEVSAPGFGLNCHRH
jgi:hypothetical protein